MENINRENKIILLFETFSSESVNLYDSFLNLGIDFQAVVLEDDGFLPEGIISPFTYYLGSFENTSGPLYFNEIEIPDFWEINGTNTNASVYDYKKERARIFYSKPEHKRFVKIVDWLDESGIVRLSEHYNKYGKLFCKTFFNQKGQKVHRIFYNENGIQVLYENFVTDDVILSIDGKDSLFSSKKEFVLYFLNDINAKNANVFYNSLSNPFLLSVELDCVEGVTDALFWSESLNDIIPGNMQFIFDGKAKRTKRIYVQKHDAYNKLIELGAPMDMVQELGYIYNFKRENQFRNKALICTNSDQIECLGKIVEGVPIDFHICAITEMSSELMKYEKYDNVYLYPSASQAIIDQLFEECDFYLDINREGEIVDAVHRAFLNNMLILGFEDTIHNPSYIALQNVFPKKKHDIMIHAITSCINEKDIMKKALDVQKRAALSCKKEEYLL